MPCCHLSSGKQDKKAVHDLAITLLSFAIGFCGTVLVLNRSTFLQVPNTTAGRLVAQLRTSASNLPTIGRRDVLATGIAAAVAMTPQVALARKPGVNKPELLPAGDVVNVIDLAGMLTPSQIKELERNIEAIQRLYGVKLRVLCQRYPETPGEAIVDYWKVDDSTIVLVADDTFPNLLNFNVGVDADLLAPNGRFWTQLRANFGTQTFVRKNGEDEAILEAVEAILDGMTNVDQRGKSMLLGL
eukprot:EG_transcript_20226